MGRHETFETAAPIDADLLAGTILSRSPDPDPIYAAIEAHRVARAAFEATVSPADKIWVDARGGDTSDDAMASAVAARDAACDVESETWNALFELRPTTQAGLAALIAHAGQWVSEQQGYGMVTPEEIFARLHDAVIGLAFPPAAATSVCTSPGRTGEGEIDPIHALIEAHRAAYAEWDQTASVWNEMPLNSPGYAAAEAASHLPGQREVETYEALFSVEPTTLGGAKALAEYLVVAVRRVSADAEPSDGDRALRTLSEALSRLLSSGATDGPGRDWQAYAAQHPGFVPYPAHAPASLMALDLAIQGEAKRLLALAEAEVERRRQDYAGYPDPEVWPQVERSLRREMRMEALAAAASTLTDEDGPSDPSSTTTGVRREAGATRAWGCP